MKRSEAPHNEAETKIIILCENCSQKLRIPRRNKKLRVTCPTCRHEFGFRYYGLGFSSNSKKPLLIGLFGSLIGFSIVEIIEQTNVSVPTSLVIGAFGTCLGATMGAADGFLHKNKGSLFYGLRVGAVLGFISGCVSGLIAQYIFSTILDTVSTEIEPSIARVIFARTIGWCILGLLIGASYGIKENTAGDVKFGLIGGAIGGAIGGVLFDTFGSIVEVGNGTLGRLVGFSVLGMAISIAINHLREGAIRNNR